MIKLFSDGSVPYGLATLNWPKFFPYPISETNGLVTHSKISQFSVDTTEYFYVSQIYRKHNRTQKESRSLQCVKVIKVTNTEVKFLNTKTNIYCGNLKKTIYLHLISRGFIITDNFGG